MNVYLLGGAGYGNFGDEFIVRGWLDWFSGKQCRVTVDGENASFLQGLFGERYLNATFRQTFGKLRYAGPRDFWASFGRGLSFFKNGGLRRYPHLVAYENEIADSHIIHLHGGGYLNVHWPQNAFLLGVAIAAKRNYGSRLIATGLGLMPMPKLPSGLRDEVVQAFQEFECIEVRDYQSFLALKEVSPAANVVFGLDDSFLLSLEVQRSGDRYAHFSYYGEANDFGAAADLAGSALNSGIVKQIKFWECTTRDSLKFLSLLEKMVGDVDVIPYEKLVQQPLPVASGDVMISARFHPHLLSARMGAVGFYQSNGAYYDHKHGSVLALGSGFIPIGKNSNIKEVGDNRVMKYLDRARVNWKLSLAQALYQL